MVLPVHLVHGMTTLAGMAALTASVAVVGWSAWIAPQWTLALVALVAAVALLNLRFYAFYVRERGPLFAAAVVPMHILYFFYSGLSFAVGLFLHLVHDRSAHAA